MLPLTEKQRRILKFIESRLDKGNPVSQREIAQHFGLVQNSVCQFVAYLKDKGYLTDKGGHRGLRLSEDYLKEKQAHKGLPVVGKVAAGEPLLAEENIREYIDINKTFKTTEKTFLLEITGNSMKDEGIMDGDLVAVQPEAEVRNGDIAVVLLDDEATVKRVYFRKSKIILKPANKKYKTMQFKSKDKQIRITGKVTACLRTKIQ
jgi:repressor LexA